MKVREVLSPQTEILKHKLLKPKVGSLRANQSKTVLIYRIGELQIQVTFEQFCGPVHLHNFGILWLETLFFVVTQNALARKSITSISKRFYGWGGFRKDHNRCFSKLAPTFYGFKEVKIDSQIRKLAPSDRNFVAYYISFYG